MYFKTPVTYPPFACIICHCLCSVLELTLRCVSVCDVCVFSVCLCVLSSTRFVREFSVWFEIEACSPVEMRVERCRRSVMYKTRRWGRRIESRDVIPSSYLRQSVCVLFNAACFCIQFVEKRDERRDEEEEYKQEREKKENSEMILV